MGKQTGISWTDHTFNPWWGCTVVSPGCDNCYAQTFSERPIHKLPDGSIGALQIWGKGVPRRTFDDRHWNEPLTWNRAAEREGRKHKVFCASMADIMDDEAPLGARERLWDLIDRTPHLIWQLLTKRPHRFMFYLPNGFRWGNVWLGVTAEDQHYYDVRWPILHEQARLRLGIAATWISYEPALGPLRVWAPVTGSVPNWIVFGGESGAGWRPCQVEWAEQLRTECEMYRIAFFMKQMNGSTPAQAKKAIPSDLMLQEFPAV